MPKRREHASQHPRGAGAATEDGVEFVSSLDIGTVTVTRRSNFVFPLCKYHHGGKLSILKAVSEFLDLRQLWLMRGVNRWCLHDFDRSKLLREYLLNVENPGICRVHFWLNLVEGGSTSSGSSRTGCVADNRGRTGRNQPSFSVAKRGTRVNGSSGTTAEQLFNAEDPLGDNPQIEAEIWRDVHRTFPQHPLFRQVGGAGQTLLTSILKQCAAMNKEVGYCQGMNYVAAVLLTEALELNDLRSSRQAPAAVVAKADAAGTKRSSEANAAGSSSRESGPTATIAAGAAAGAGRPGLGRGMVGMSETTQMQTGRGSPWTVARMQRAYQCFDSTLERCIVRIMHALINNPRYSMYGLWTNGVPDLRLRLYQLDKIVEVHLPRLHEHLSKIGLKPAQYCSQWFVTLLSSTLPPRRLIRLWDNYFLRGWPFFFQVAVALLALNESTILCMDLEDASKFFRNQQPRRRFFNVAIQTVLSEARHLNITAPQLERLALEFKQEEVDEQLKLPPESSSRTLRASAEAIAEYQGMEATALADAAVLRQKIESAARMYVDAAGRHRSTTAAVARGNRTMKRMARAIENAPDPASRQRILEEQSGTAEALRTTMQEHATAELKLDEAQQQRDSFSEQLVHVLDGWEVRRLKAAAKLYDSGINHQP